VQGRLFPIDADWCEWRQQPQLDGTVLVRIAAGPGGRLVLAGLRIDGELSAELLRSIPLGRIEAVANAQLTIVDDEVVLTAAPGPRDGPTPRQPQPVDAGWEMTDPVGATARPHSARRRSSKIEQPAEAGRGRPDSFYRDVADIYQDLAQRSSRPAADLAEANSLPVTTAHRWIKEARRRGFLPPGRPGKTG
jgi:hypothetical protein